MSLLSLAAALIVVTNGGTVSVQKDLTDRDCAEAASIVQTGRGIEEEADLVAREEAARDKAVADLRPQAKAWFAGHPKQEVAHCFPGSFYSCFILNRDGELLGVAQSGGGVRSYSQDEWNALPKTVECVP